MLVTGTRMETIETAEAIDTAKVGEYGDKSKDEYPNLAQVLCIWCPITFQKKFVPVLALLDLVGEVNAIHLTFARELGLPIKTTDVGAQKIDDIKLNTFGIVVVAFSVTDKTNWVRFFEETFLVANVSLEVVFEIPILTLSGADVDFLGRKLR